MPTYEYLCRECGHQLEVMQRMTDPRLTTCPSCQAEALEKQISAVSFQLKGTGWYETDFKNSGKAAAKSDDGGDSDSKKTTAAGDTGKTGDNKSASASGDSSSSGSTKSNESSSTKSAAKTD